jgi:hypothetical protein
MLSSITPLGERSKGNRWGVTVVAHVLGSAVAGAAVGLLAWVVGLPLRAVVPAEVLFGAVLLATAAAAVLEARPALVPRLPGWRRQVDEGWLTAYRGVVYGLGYGVQLGAAVATIVTTAAIPLVLVAAAAAPPLAGGIGIGTLFGLARGASVLASRGITDPEGLRRFHRRFEERAGAARWASAATLALAATGVGVVTFAGLVG